MNAPLLRVTDLRTWIPAGEHVVRAVDGLSFDIARGETFALVGESGCGKSMTALSVMRLLPEAAVVAGGTVELDGKNLLTLPEAAMRDVRGGRIAMIFQEPNLSLNPVMTAGEQIAETLRRHTELEGAALEARVLEILDAVRIPDAKQRQHDYPFQLSGGMKQRVMIAIALSCNPALLVADEPTTALDVTIQAQIIDLLRELQAERQMSVLLITHDLGVVADFAHRVAVMYAGEIVEMAGSREFFAAPKHPYAQKLFDSLPTVRKRGQPLAVIRGSVPPLTQAFSGCRFVERCEHAMPKCSNLVPAWTELGAACGVRCHLHVPGMLAEAGLKHEKADVASEQALIVNEVNVADALLRVNDLKIHFPIRKGLLKRTVGQVNAVDGVTFAIARGRTLGLVGESGCGKTTIGKGILRLIEPTSGDVLYDGEDLVGLNRTQLRSRRRHVQIIFQDPYASLNPRMRVVETIEEGMAALNVGGARKERMTRIDALLSEVGLSPDVKFRYPHEFSGGQRQRIAIARALAVDPQLIICDEPTSALDVSVQAQILNLLKDLQARKGLSYLFITHNISVVEFVAHELAVMYLGRIVEQGLVDEVLREPRHPYTRALLSAVPDVDPTTQRQAIRLDGDLPSPIHPPAGCHFHPRCPQVMAQCRVDYPQTAAYSSTHAGRCHLYKNQ
ncbi:MAG: ABC transporter ATP-binding protein [Burkholderiales bacterium]